MCGIIGYCGKEEAAPYLLKGLYSLEYRGYDSAGLCVFAPRGMLTVKTAGRVADLQQKWDALPERPFARCGIGHTRWATDGAPTEKNAHPHRVGSVSIVHNGIIENSGALRVELQKKGYVFVSQTDTEVLAALLDEGYQAAGNIPAAIRYAESRVTGSFAVAAMFEPEKDTVWAFRKESPLIAATAPNGNFLASDIFAVSRYTSQYYPLQEEEIAVLRPDGLSFLKKDGTPLEKDPVSILTDSRQAEKGAFPHHMLKEIFDAPDAIRETVAAYLRDGLPSLSLLDPKGFLRRAKRLFIVACGTALNAGKIGKFYFEKLAGLSTYCAIASEFRYDSPILQDGDHFLFITQSGETADTLAAMRMVRGMGFSATALVNTPNSTAVNLADSVLYTRAGPEIAVASTKAYVAQCSLLYLVANAVALYREKINAVAVRENVHALYHDAPICIANLLADREAVRAISQKYCEAPSCFFIGRGLDYSLTEESSLKCKEISYIHCEAYPAGELKHGTIALIEENTPVVTIVSGEMVREKTFSNIREVRARGGKVLLVTDRHAETQVADDLYIVPAKKLFPVCAAVFFQLFAYYGALLRGCDVDKPRNLAKSVTVE